MNNTLEVLHLNRGSEIEHRILKRLVGEENVYVVDVGLSEAAHREEKYIAYGKYRNILDRLHQLHSGERFIPIRAKLY